MQNVGFALYYAGRYDESTALLLKSIEMNPADPWPRMMLASTWVELGRRSEATAECDRAVAAASDDQNVLAVCGRVYGLAGRRARALELFGRLEALAAKHYVDPYNMAWIRDGVGDTDGALSWLERALAERSAGISGAGSEHWSPALRGSARFQRLLRAMNYPAAERR